MALGFPSGGVALAFVALALWVSGAPWRALDGVVIGLFGAGLLLSAAGYFFARPVSWRRFGVIGMGLNAFGLTLLLILYGAG